MQEESAHFNAEAEDISRHNGAQSPELVSLVDAARGGDNDALAAIYERFCDRIYQYARFKLGDAAQAEDVCAQVFLKMMESIGRFEWRSVTVHGVRQVNSASFSAWLYRIAHNLITDQLRQKSRRPAVSLDSVAGSLSGSNDPTVTAEEHLLREQLATAMDALTDLQAQVIALKFGSGLSNAEVGHMMGRTEGAVKALQYSALQKLNHLLSQVTDV